MHRLPLALLTAAVAGCAPSFSTVVGWTVDGADAATVCPALSPGTTARLTAVSRDTADSDDVETSVVTPTDADCAKGSVTLFTGPFADVFVELVDGDVVHGVAPVLRIAPGAPSPTAGPAVADVRIVRGTLRATLTVGGRSCGDAGATSFSASLWQYAEARTAAPVVSDVDVACEGGVAVFTHAPVDLGATYFVTAITTTADGVTWSTGEAGRAVIIDGANAALVVDLDR
ncbi:MAG: hypothetical protein FJ137_04240 [Deltaproteobacteria bacterium]|nr:hypothetical protein [Deltaproteobacteria bacterium]